MDGHTQLRSVETNSFKKSSGSDHSKPVEVLLIGRDPTMRVYTDEVLRQAGFHVRSITPWEAKGVLNDDVSAYSLVVFTNTLFPADVSEIGSQLRKRSPGSKLLLMLGPDPMPVSPTMFDGTLEGLDGPAALVREARRLTASSPGDGAANSSATRSA